MLCFADTPEGESCGLVKNLALMTHVTTDMDEAPLKALAYLLGVRPALMEGPRELHASNTALVFVNGSIIGCVGKPKRFARELREMRRRGAVGEFVSVYMLQDSLYIASDGGRVCRPLIICDNGVPRVTQEHLEVWVFVCVGRGGDVVLCLGVLGGCWWCAVMHEYVLLLTFYHIHTLIIHKSTNTHTHSIKNTLFASQTTYLHHTHPPSHTHPPPLPALLPLTKTHKPPLCMDPYPSQKLKVQVEGTPPEWGFQDFLRNGLVEYLDVNEVLF